MTHRVSFFLIAGFVACVSMCCTHAPSAEKNKNRTFELTVEEEELLARETLQTVRHDYPAYKDAEVQTYIANLGSRLVKANNLKGQPFEYSFTVVDVPSVNAFALPAGKVFITVPLIASVESEAELAGVLGHEIGHITAHHAALRMEAERNSKSHSWAYGSGGAIAGGVVGGIGASMICPGGETLCTQQLMGFSVGAGVNTGLLIQKYRFLANSQENELEADRLGFAISKKAGYSAEHINDFYRRQQKRAADTKNKKAGVGLELLDSIATHPSDTERIHQIDLLASQTVTPSGAILSTPEFDKIRKRLKSLGANE